MFIFLFLYLQITQTYKQQGLSFSNQYKNVFNSSHRHKYDCTLLFCN